MNALCLMLCLASQTPAYDLPDGSPEAIAAAQKFNAYMTSSDPKDVAERARRHERILELARQGVPVGVANRMVNPDMPRCNASRVAFIAPPKPQKPKPPADEYLPGIGSKRSYEEWQRRKALKPGSILSGKIGPQKVKAEAKAVGKWPGEKTSFSE